MHAKKNRKKEKLHVINYLQRTTISFYFILLSYILLYVRINGSISQMLMLLCYCIRIEIYTFIQRKSALQMSILFFLCVCVFVCINTLHTNYFISTQYPLGNDSYVNCEHVLKHILLKHTEYGILVWWIPYSIAKACQAIGTEYVRQFNILYNQPNSSDSLTESIRWVSVTCLVVRHLAGIFSLTFESFSLSLSSSIQYWAKFNKFPCLLTCFF